MKYTNENLLKIQQLLKRFKTNGLSAKDILSFIKLKKEVDSLLEGYFETVTQIMEDNGVKKNEEYKWDNKDINELVTELLKAEAEVTTGKFLSVQKENIIERQDYDLDGLEILYELVFEEDTEKAKKVVNEDVESV